MKTFDDFIKSIENLSYKQKLIAYIKYFEDFENESAKSSYKVFEENITALLADNIVFEKFRSSLEQEKNIRNWRLGRTPKKETIIKIVLEIMDCYIDDRSSFKNKDIDFLTLCNDLLSALGLSSLYYRDPTDIQNGYFLKYKKSKNDRANISQKIKINFIPKLYIPLGDTKDLLSSIRSYFEDLDYRKFHDNEVVYTTTFFNNQQQQLHFDEELIDFCVKNSEHFCKLRHKTLKNLIEILDITLLYGYHSEERISNIDGIQYVDVDLIPNENLSINRLNNIYKNFYGYGKEGYYSNDVTNYITQQPHHQSSKQKDDITGLTVLEEILTGHKEVITRKNFLLWLLVCENFNSDCDLSNINETLVDSEYAPIQGRENVDTVSNLVSFAFYLNNMYKEKISLGKILYDLHCLFIKNDLFFPLWS